MSTRDGAILRALALALAACGGLAGTSMAAIIRVDTQVVGNKLDLVAIEVTSGAGGGLPNRALPFESLIPTTVTDYVSVTESSSANEVTVLATPDGASAAGDGRLRLLGDRSLNTGIFNPSYGTPGVQVTFDTPIVNGPGVDLVLFELTIGSGQSPDPFELLRPGLPQHVYRAQSGDYEIQASIPAGATPQTLIATVAANGVADLPTLRDATLVAAGFVSNPKWHAISVDLDWIGVAPWQEVESLHILSDNAARNTPVDLLMVMGLPAATHPADFDRDSHVTVWDYSHWASEYGSAGMSDGNGDGVVDAADYTIWRDASDALFTAVSAPEPQAWWSALCGAMSLAALRSGRRR